VTVLKTHIFLTIDLDYLIMLTVKLLPLVKIHRASLRRLWGGGGGGGVGRVLIRVDG